MKKDFIKLELTTLETKTLRGDLIGVFNVLKGYENIDIDFFNISQSSHSLKINKKSQIRCCEIVFQQ